jgi:RimJ/RimL family protein N-acetyltransferase
MAPAPSFAPGFTLPGRRLDLVPLTVEHADALFAVLDPGLFTILAGRPAAWTPEAFRAFVAAASRAPGRVPFALRLREASGTIVGSSSFFDIRAEHKGCEIGFTWIARPWQGTFVNPESKFLLLRHAFETWGLIRVQLKTDARNQQSQHAMAKLGCTREGVLRRHMIVGDGHVRDTVLFSITDQDWPRVKQGLVERLGYEP